MGKARQHGNILYNGGGPSASSAAAGEPINTVTRRKYGVVTHQRMPIRRVDRRLYVSEEVQLFKDRITVYLHECVRTGREWTLYGLHREQNCRAK